MSVCPFALTYAEKDADLTVLNLFQWSHNTAFSLLLTFCPAYMLDIINTPFHRDD